MNGWIRKGELFFSKKKKNSRKGQKKKDKYIELILPRWKIIFQHWIDKILLKINKLKKYWRNNL